MGLTDAGFVKPPLADIKQSIEDALRASLGASINLLPSSVFAQIVTVVADREDLQWQGQLNLFSGFNPDTASGALLRYLVKLTGVTPLAASKSTVTLTVSLDATTTLPVGRLISNPTTKISFVTTEEVTSTAAGNYSVAAESVLTGPIAGAAGSLTQIDTPVTGWSSVTNAVDALSGRNFETDAEIRVRRLISIAASGGTTKNAILADIAAVDNITDALVLVNDTDFTDVNGVPPHRFEVVTLGGSASDITSKIFNDSMAAGIGSFGTASAPVIDSEGNTNTIYYTPAIQTNAYVKVQYFTNKFYPVDGDDLVKAAIATLNLNIGETLYNTQLYSAAYSITGVENVTLITVGSTDPALNTQLSAQVREKLVLDASRVSIVIL